MRDHGHGMLLVVVRRQPMILRPDKPLEEGPGLAGQRAEKAHLLGRQAGLATGQGAAHPPGEGGRGQPEHEDRPRDDQHGRVEPRQHAEPVTRASTGAIHILL